MRGGKKYWGVTLEDGEIAGRRELSYREPAASEHKQNDYDPMPYQ